MRWPIIHFGKGVQLKSNENLTLQKAKPPIDEWAEAVRQTLAARFKPGGQ